MDNYGQVLWLPICAGLTAIGVLFSVLVWRRRGAPSGLRIFSWSLLPMGVYLIGVLPVIVPFGIRLVTWVTDAVFSLTAWIGVALLALAVLVWIVSGRLLSRRSAAVEGDGDTDAVTSRSSGKEVTAGSSSTPAKDAKAKTSAAKDKSADDDGMGDIEDILKRRGIT
ncbi:MAG: cellulose synthase [Streptosporangiales bacterium]|nr:cellulose synthase [Streptosporangiales bacterium]